MRLTDDEFDQLIRIKFNELKNFPNLEQNWEIIAARLDSFNDENDLNEKSVITTCYIATSTLKEILKSHLKYMIPDKVEAKVPPQY